MLRLDRLLSYALIVLMAGALSGCVEGSRDLEQDLQPVTSLSPGTYVLFPRDEKGNYRELLVERIGSGYNIFGSEKGKSQFGTGTNGIPAVKLFPVKDDRNKVIVQVLDRVSPAGEPNEYKYVVADLYGDMLAINNTGLNLNEKDPSPAQQFSNSVKAHSRNYFAMTDPKETINFMHFLAGNDRMLDWRGFAMILKKKN